MAPARPGAVSVIPPGLSNSLGFRALAHMSLRARARQTCAGRVAGSGERSYIPLMANNSANPYTLEIEACERPAGHFTWAIRRNGKLFQRADRVQTTEEAAERSGLAALEKLLSGRER